NGSTFRMIPVIFRKEKLREVEGQGAEAQAAALKVARVEAAAVLGFVSAVGACGGYLIPRSFGASIHATGTPVAALGGFLAFYATCVVVTWVNYLRKTPVSAAEPQFAAEV
ncbi:MAG TPA: hypothetical protein VLJ38_20060, partial [Polyangiaceae bacterium]|nr:hypothetical protein [Polyangiaceae bacterium]